MNELTDYLHLYAAGRHGMPSAIWSRYAAERRDTLGALDMASKMERATLGASKQLLADLHEMAADTVLRRAMGDVSHQSVSNYWGPDAVASMQHVVEGNKFLVVNQNYKDMYITSNLATIRQAAEGIGVLSIKQRLSDLLGTDALVTVSHSNDLQSTLNKSQFSVSSALTELHSLTEKMHGRHGTSHIQEIIDNHLIHSSTTSISPLIQNLSKLSNLPFDRELINNALYVASYVDVDSLLYENDYLDELENTKSEIEASSPGQSYDFLSPRAKEHIVAIIYCIAFTFSSIIEGIATNYIYDEYIKKAENYGELNSYRDVRKLTKCQNNLVPLALSHCRIVSRSSIEIRINPSRKSQTVATLARGAAVSVIDDSDRTWLFVEVLSEDVHIEGWILRRYVEKFR